MQYATALRVEWCRCHARAMRYSEEVELLLEEMRRVVLESPVRSGYWALEGSNRDRDRLVLAPKHKLTEPDHLKPVTVG